MQTTPCPILVRSYAPDGCVLRALDAGAGDYVTKPFQTEEFLARRAFVDNIDMHLTRTEFALLVTLAQNCDAVLSHDELLARVWGEEYRGSNHYLHVYPGRIRKKLGDKYSPLLETVAGMGYILHSCLHS